MTQEQKQVILDKVKLSNIKNLDDIKQLLCLEYTFGGYSYNNQLWELPLVTEHNEKNKKHIFNQYFFGIYDNKHINDSGLVLIVGRCGNTHNYWIKNVL